MIHFSFRPRSLGWVLIGFVVVGLAVVPHAHRRFRSFLSHLRLDASPRALLRPAIRPGLFDCTARALPASSGPDFVPCIFQGNCRAPQISGHRGVGADRGRLAPESTLAAFRAAIALKLDYVELDPRLTLDGILVVIHDATVDRTTLGSGEVKDLDFASIERLRLRTDRFWGRFDCERVPTFREVLELCRGRIVILVDAEKTDRIDLIVNEIRAAHAEEWVVFDARDLSKVDRALALDPRLRLHIRPPGVEDIVPQLTRYGRAVAIVELRRAEIRAGAPIVHRFGARVLTNVFEEDERAEFTEDLSGFEQALRDGADILQGDRPELLLKAVTKLRRNPPHAVSWRSAANWRAP